MSLSKTIRSAMRGLWHPSGAASGWSGIRAANRSQRGSMMEDHCGGRTLGAGTHVTKRLHQFSAVSRVPLSRRFVSWYLGGNTPWELCVELQGESAILRPVTCPKLTGTGFKVTGEVALRSYDAGPLRRVTSLLLPFPSVLH